jgi:dihydroxy-acid dehydratase
MVTPCNMHIDKLAVEASIGVNDAGGKAIIFGTITISDGISMGTEGMKYSLVSREVIADSIETVSGCEGFDGLVAIGGCDKNMPGCIMALARLNRPGIFVYGGTILPGCFQNKNVDIVSVFEAVGGNAAGRVSDAELLEVERKSIPGPGSCGGMYTANTMASAAEALGLSLPGSSTQEAVGTSKLDDCRRAGEAVVKLLKAGIRPRDILTRKAFENAMRKAIEYMRSHPAEARKLIAGFTRAKPEMVEAVPMDDWSTTLSAADVEKTLQIMKQEGVLKKPLSAKDMLYGAR